MGSKGSPVGDLLLQKYKLAPDLYLGWCLALGSVRFSKLSRRLLKSPPWSGAVTTKDTRLQLLSYPGPFSISSSQIPVDPDKPCPSWCLQSANTRGHLCCPGRPGRTNPFCLSLSPCLCLFMACPWLQLTAPWGLLFSLRLSRVSTTLGSF